MSWPWHCSGGSDRTRCPSPRCGSGASICRTRRVALRRNVTRRPVVVSALFPWLFHTFSGVPVTTRAVAPGSFPSPAQRARLGPCVARFAVVRSRHKLLETSLPIASSTPWLKRTAQRPASRRPATTRRRTDQPLSATSDWRQAVCDAWAGPLHPSTPWTANYVRQRVSTSNISDESMRSHRIQRAAKVVPTGRASSESGLP